MQFKNVSPANLTPSKINGSKFTKGHLSSSGQKSPFRPGGTTMVDTQIMEEKMEVKRSQKYNTNSNAGANGYSSTVRQIN
jgi:hypothetical protein